jgi:adenosylcobinamide kinase/adenosylcobinamide-phosphate guanylyltransferase
MLALVLGRAASGKSEFAEALAMSLSSERYYIATMQSYDAESERRIARHREMRCGKGFETVERALNLSGLTICAGQDSVALLECASTLLGNELCMPGGAAERAEASSEVICEGVKSLLRQGMSSVVVVSNDIFGEGEPQTHEMQEYSRQLGLLNQKIAALADEVIEVVCGIPIYHKGENLNI